MKIERSITWFDKTSGEFKDEYILPNLDVNVLKEIFVAKDEDQLLYDPYPIEVKEAENLSHLLKNRLFLILRIISII